MRCFAIVLVLGVLVQVAPATQNPELRVYLDFDPPNRINTIEPEVGSFFDVYIVCDQFGPDGGLRCVPFAFERTFGGEVVGQTMLFDGLQLGDVEDPEIGWVCVSFECLYPDEAGQLLFSYVTYYYSGPPGELSIIRTEADEGGAVDCLVERDYYCIGGHAGIWTSAPPGEPECPFGITPVECSSWGVVKALFR